MKNVKMREMASLLGSDDELKRIMPERKEQKQNKNKLKKTTFLSFPLHLHPINPWIGFLPARKH